MIKIKLITLVAIVILAISCKKESTTNKAIDYSKVKIKQAIVHRGVIDTITYFYNGENVEEHSVYGSAPLHKDITKFFKNGNQFDLEYYSNTVKTYEGFSKLNAQGFIDTSRLTKIATMSIGSREKFYYDANGFSIRQIYDYNSYILDYKKFYSVDNNYLYWISNVNYPATPANNIRDSMAFEYDLSKPLYVPFEYALQERYGKPTKHLETRRHVYNTLAGNVLKSTREYQYEVDADGLVIKRIYLSYAQPGNVLADTDTTYYSYYMN